MILLLLPPPLPVAVRVTDVPINNRWWVRAVTTRFCSVSTRANLHGTMAVTPARLGVLCMIRTDAPTSSSFLRGPEESRRNTETREGKSAGNVHAAVCACGHPMKDECCAGCVCKGVRCSGRVHIDRRALLCVGHLAVPSCGGVCELPVQSLPLPLPPDLLHGPGTRCLLVCGVLGQRGELPRAASLTPAGRHRVMLLDQNNLQGCRHATTRPSIPMTPRHSRARDASAQRSWTQPLVGEVVTSPSSSPPCPFARDVCAWSSQLPGLVF